MYSKRFIYKLERINIAVTSKKEQGIGCANLYNGWDMYHEKG